MRFFASSHQIHQLAPRTVLFSLFLLVGIAGQAVSGILMHHRGPGWTPTSIVAHYCGNHVDLATLDDAAMAEALAGAPGYTDTPAKPFSSLLDVAHMHLAWMPLLVFIVAHLFAMTPAGRGIWGAILGYGTLVAALADIVTPFLIRYVSPHWALVKLMAFLALEIGLLAMIAGILWAGISAMKKHTRHP